VTDGCRSGRRRSTPGSRERAVDERGVGLTLAELLQSQDVKAYIEQTFAGAVIPGLRQH
jgi:hypothetical protein